MKNLVKIVLLHFLLFTVVYGELDYQIHEIIGEPKCRTKGSLKYVEMTYQTILKCGDRIKLSKSDKITYSDSNGKLTVWEGRRNVRIGEDNSKKHIELKLYSNKNNFKIQKLSIIDSFIIKTAVPVAGVRGKSSMTNRNTYSKRQIRKINAEQ